MGSIKHIPGLLMLGFLICCSGAGMRGYTQNPPDEVTALIAQLKDANAAVRRKSAEGLEGYARVYPQVVPPLIGALADADPAVRKFAAAALGSARDPHAVPPLLELLKDGNPNIRGTAVEALGQIGQPKAAPRLIDLLRTDAAMRPAALAALAQIGDDASRQAILDFIQTKQFDGDPNLAMDLGRLGDDATAAVLLAMLRTPDHPQRRFALLALGVMQEPSAADYLLALLKDDEFDDPFILIEAVGFIGDPRATEPVAECLRDRMSQAFAVRALSRIGTPRAVDALMAFTQLKGEDAPEPADLHETIEALGSLRDLRAVPVLLKMLAACGEEDDYRRGLIVKALGCIGDARAVDALLPLTATGESYQRCAVIDALRQIASTKAVPTLAEAIADIDNEVHSEAAFALAAIPDPAAVKPLVAALRKDVYAYQYKFDWGVNELFAMLAHNPAVTVEDFAFLLSGEQFLPELFLVLGKEGITNPRLLQAMIGQLERGAYWQDEVLDEAYRSYGEAGVTALLEFVDKKKGNGAAERILGRSGDARAVESIRNRHKLGYGEALKALGRLKSAEVFEPAMARLHQPIADGNDEYQRLFALEALGGLGDPRAVEAIAAVLRNPEGESADNTRATAARALGEIGDAEAADSLISVLEISDPFLFREVIRALGKLPPDERITAVLLDTLFDARDDLIYEGTRRVAAAEALAKNTDPRVTPALLTALRQGNPSAPWVGALINVLAARNDSQAARVIIYYLTNHQLVEVRLAAARALGELKSSGAVLPLARALRDADPAVRAAASASLTQITGQHLGQDAAAWQTWWVQNHVK